jgi:DNA-directed RNA polymerase beta subunit
MVTDKMYARGSGGPKDMMTQQPLHGRARGGGLRNGEMERDVLLSHGISQFAKETYFERADGYKTFMDTDTGNIVPPNHMGAKCVKFPYAFKLLQQEATTMGVKMKLEIQDN